MGFWQLHCEQTIHFFPEDHGEKRWCSSKLPIKGYVLQSDFFPLLFSNNSFGLRVSCAVRHIHHSVRLIMLTSYFKQNGNSIFWRSYSFSDPSAGNAVRVHRRLEPGTGTRKSLTPRLTDLFILSSGALLPPLLILLLCSLFLSLCPQPGFGCFYSVHGSGWLPQLDINSDWMNISESLLSILGRKSDGSGSLSFG